MDNAFIAIGLSVLMHVTWNLFARHVAARCNYLWWGLLAHLLLLAPWALWQLWQNSRWSQTLVLALVISALANSVYFLALRKAYHFAPVALVYPIARSSPIIIALWGWLIFNQTIAAHALLGIVVCAAGLWLLAGTSKHGDARHALPWALFAAFATSVYSLSDKIAVVDLPDFGSQLGFISVGYFASFITLSLVQFKERGRFWPACRPKLFYILLGGLFIGVAYALVVRAMLFLPAAYVVAYTNAGIVLATLASIFIFKENTNWQRRWLASVVVCFGLLILSFDMFAR